MTLESRLPLLLAFSVFRSVHRATMIEDVERLQKENSRLRSLLLYYEDHHRYCAIGRQPSPPPDEERTNGAYTDRLLVPVAIVHDLHTAVEDSNELTIISFELHSPSQVEQKLKTKSPQRDSQWRTVADQLIAKVPDATKWSTTREDLGLRSMKDNINVISTFSGASVHHYRGLVNNHHELTTETISDGTSDGYKKASHYLIALATNYARKTKSCQVNATFACLLKSFQELIFISLCAVLEQTGTDVAFIDDAMRICISNTDRRNLKRLRYGAVWVNTLINDLAKSKSGWDSQRATEMVLLCGLTVSKYGILAASSDSLAHLSSLLGTSNYTTAASGILCGGPFSIPALIKVLVGDNLRLKDICNTLQYRDSCLGEVGQLFSWYQTVLNCPEVSAGGTVSKKRKLNASHAAIGHENEDNLTPHQRMYSASSQEDSQQDLATRENDLRGRIRGSRLPLAEVDCNQSDTLRQRCEAVDSLAIEENAFIPSQLTESYIEDSNETLNSGNTLFSIDYNGAYNLATIAFDYDAAFDLTSIAFIDNTAYNLPSFPDLPVLEGKPTEPEPSVVPRSLQDEE